METTRLASGDGAQEGDDDDAGEGAEDLDSVGDEAVPDAAGESGGGAED